MRSRTNAALLVWLGALCCPAAAQPVSYQESVPEITIDAANGSWRTIKFVPTFKANVKRIAMRNVSVLCTFVNSDPAVLPHAFFDLRFAPERVHVRVPFSQISIIEDAGNHYKYMVGNSPLFAVLEPASDVLLNFIGAPTPPETIGACEVSFLGESVF